MRKIANMENEQKKPHDQSNSPSTPIFPTDFIDLDEIMSVDEPTIIKRTRNVLSDSELSEMAQLKTK
jgi:hypothetical protein